MSLFKQVTIVGLGLIGGSIGMAIRRRRIATTVVGLSRSTATVRRARHRGAIDWGTTETQPAITAADVVVVSTPVDAIVSSALRVARWMRPGALLLDVGSTKAEIVRVLERRLPHHVSYVGCHPLAGSEQRGIGAAQPRLFEGSVCLVTPTPHTSQPAKRRVVSFWKALGCRVVSLSVDRHDRLLASTSHLPHLVAYCLAGTVRPVWRTVIAPSFLEMTRIAHSDPELWDDIFFSNRDALLTVIDDFDRYWHRLRAALRRRNRAGLRHLLARARARPYPSAS